MGVIQKFTNAVAGSRAVDKVQSAIDWVGGAKNSVQGWAGSLFTVASNGSTFVGMNYDAVPTIRDAIRTYVKNVQTVTDGLNTDADANQAVHGEIEAETKKYLQAIKEVADAYVSTLLVYSDKMQEYYEQYSERDTKLSQDVSDESASLTSKASEIVYTEQK